MRSRPAFVGGLLVLAACASAPGRAADDTAPDAVASIPQPTARPTMRQLDAGQGAAGVPTAQDIALARPEIRRRFREPLSHADSSAGAIQAAETLLSASGSEADRTLRWLMIDEARRLGEASGQAVIVSRAIAAAAASYDFDAIDAELRTLKQIPLRLLDAPRAAAVAAAAERIAASAAADARPDKAMAAEMLASRAWQRAGNQDAARRAAARHDAALAGRNADAASR